MSDIADAIARAQRDVEAAQDERTCERGAYRQGCEECEAKFPNAEARARLARLGPASVVLAAALAELGHKPEDYCQVAACPGCQALQDWADAQQGGAGGA